MNMNSDFNKGLNECDGLAVQVAKADFCFGVDFETPCLEHFVQAISHMSAQAINNNQDEANCFYS